MAESVATKPSDRRVRRSRSALTSAFNRLVLERGFDAVTVADLVEAANVGRSTFYEHYAGLEDLLRQSVQPPFAALAAESLAPAPAPRLAQTLRHFWDNRKVGYALLSGGSGRVLQGLLVEQIEAALQPRWAARDEETASRRRLLACHLAAGQLAVLTGWLSGRLAGSAEEVAEALRSAARGAATGLLGAEDLLRAPQASSRSA